jgi:hypothetical protein
MAEQQLPEIDVQEMSIYQRGDYLHRNPTWHVEDSDWKARQILKMLKLANLKPSTLAEVGCGAGEILRLLMEELPDVRKLEGWEISPQAYELCQTRANERLSFHLANFLDDEAAFYDLLLVIDVFEHVEDFYGFLRRLHGKATHKLFHIPLDLSVNTVLRGSPLMDKRRRVGHLHSYTKDTALAALEDTGYKVEKWFYTSGLIDLPARSWRQRVARYPRRMLYAMDKDVAVRLMGGFSLMVLTT